MGKIQHGQAMKGKKSPTFIAWQTMRRRCENRNTKDYKYYGGRGITVCSRWSQFANFLADMGEKPEGLTLGRIDTDQGYCPENCRWETWKQQRANVRPCRASIKYAEIDGETISYGELEKRLGLSQGAIWHRLKKGWPLSRALTEPKQVGVLSE